ncbi:MAG: hypothetical protein IJE77_12770 [Thermoguttaceae bacterium]|nr:hypothetical protein [Thermoguttaceae bacterium]MBQ9800743.1 hypothetical protein [Thermoguttaceae bacterium]
MLKIFRTASRRFCRAAALAFCAAALAAILRPATESALRDGVVERSAERRTTDGGEVWESGGDFNDVSCVKTAKTGAFGDLSGWAKPGDRRAVERLRADFDERLRVGATEFWASRRSEPGAGVALRAVADGWARWNVGAEATARFLETLTAIERSAFERRRRSREAFDFAADRAASAEASREAAATLAALKSENEENGAEFDGGVDAALAFLRSLDGNENASESVGVDDNIKGGERDVETFLWAAGFDGNPLNAVGALAASDVVAISVPSNSTAARSTFAASAIFFFFSTFGVWGGAPPRTWTILGVLGGENRVEREFWRALDAAFRRLGVAAERLRLLFYFARLALFNAFRRFDVEDGTAKRSALNLLCASTRLLN